MGVESDRLVFDYLSRVGDLAQTAMPAAQRMRLVAQLRSDIERERRGAGAEADVRHILGRMGSPDEVVEAAAGRPAGERREEPPPAQEPRPGSYGPYTAGPGVPRQPRGAAAEREGGAERGPLWWQGGPGGPGARPGEELDGLPGMSGGIFIPDDDEELDAVGRPLPGKGADGEDGDKGKAGAEEPGEEAVPAAGPVAVAGPRRRRLLPRLPRGGGARRWGSPMLLVAAALLVGGAVAGSLIPLGLGWLTAWLSRKLTRPQAKFAVLFIPGAFAAGTLVWIWGRDVGKWGSPIAKGQMGQAFQDAYPLTVRLAAVGTALYLLWRSRRSA
ncbi:hypothetical protein [Streptomyces sp. NPDC020983]|uniref:hypothetical protein n=1 Tax=Streptomyces sp. NPDC020983 TaxID=3365106 RepID=UPI0037A86D03